ncbi:MAG: hypothetical protein ACHQNV_10710 [Vicinamibacteria bacterium]
MKAKHLFPFLVAAALAACQQQTESTTKTAKAGHPPDDGGGILKAFRPDPVIVPEGTTLHLVIETALSSATSAQGDVVVAKLADDVKVGDKVVLEQGTEVRGQVTAAAPSGRVKGLARLAFDFDRLVLRGKEHSIDARAIDITADDTHKRDAEIIGGGTVGGAIIGALAGGSKGAGIGALVGAGAGGGVVLTNKGKEVNIPSGAHLGIKLNREARLG